MNPVSRSPLRLTPIPSGEASPLDTLPNNLPRQATRFLGRESDQTRAASLLADTRLLTMTGPGGIGKTRLALEVAAAVIQQFPDGAWFVDLSREKDSADVPHAVRTALEIEDSAVRSALDSVIAWLRTKSLLLVLDNCEHVLETAADLVRELLSSCGDLKILATSREPLQVAGETSWVVPSLSVPPPQSSSELETLREWGAVDLFLDRAGKASPDLRLTGENAGAVVEVCRRLDGIPLAIELAASRCRVLSVEQVLERLEDRLSFLESRAKGGLPRHQTLRASIDWSYDLLNESEKAFFARLSVFVGSFTLEEAEAVCAGDGIEHPEVSDLLYSLVDKSLVQLSSNGADPRYHLLETMKAYAAMKLGREAGAVRLRMLDAYVRFSEQAAKSWYHDQAPWFAWMRDELPNVVAVVRYASEIQHPAAVAIPVNLSWYLWALAERRLLEPWLLSALEQRPDPEHLYGIYIGMGLLQVGGDRREFFSYFDKALAVARTLGNGFAKAQAMRWRAIGRWNLGERKEALIDLRSTVGMLEGVDDVRVPYTLSGTETMLAECIFPLGELDEAEKLWRSAVRRLPKPAMGALATFNLARHALAQGRIDDALKLSDEALSGAREIGNRFSRWFISETVASALAARGDIDAAVAWLEEGSRIGGQMDYRSALTAKRQQYLDAGLSPSGTAAVIFQHPVLGRVGYAVMEPSGTLVNDRQEFDLGAFAFAMGDTAGAGAHLERYLDGAGSLEWPGPAAEAKVALALCRLADQRMGDAVSLLIEALRPLAKYPDPTRIAFPLEALALVSCAGGDLQRAARLHGAARGIRSWNGTLPELFMRSQYEQALARARDALGHGAFDCAVGEGEQLSRTGALTYAAKGRGARKRPSAGWESLTPIELQVVRLIQDGLSNSEIAERMFLSRRTVESHVSRSLRKLGFSSRVELAMEAARREPAPFVVDLDAL